MVQIKKGQLISSDKSRTECDQHKNPCSDCPFSRKALRGWLGGATPEAYERLAHSDARVMCHVISNQQCAGMASYRTSICKSPRPDGQSPPILELPANTRKVFASKAEFLEHHEAAVLGSK